MEPTFDVSSRERRKFIEDNPTWSPDGKHIAYVNMRTWNNLNADIHIAPLGEQEDEHIVKGWYPSWSPDGTEIAYSVDQPFASQLTFINVQTRAQEQPLPKKALIWQYDPSWSATGETSLPLLGTSIRYPLSWIGICTEYGRINRRSTSSIATAPVSSSSLKKQVPKHSILHYLRMGKKFFTHRKSKEIPKSSNLI